MKRARAGERGWGKAQEAVCAYNEDENFGLRVLFLLATPPGEPHDDEARAGARFDALRAEASRIDASAELRALRAREARMDDIEGALRCPNPACRRYTATFTLANVRLGSDEGAVRVLECKACGYKRNCGD